MNSHFNRKGFLALTGATSLTAFLAACGGSSDPASSSEQTGTAAVKAPSIDPASESGGPITVFTWAGYDDSPTDGAPWMWSQYQDGDYGKSSPLKFTFLDDDSQALAKVASGYNPDIIHPCMSFIKQWQEAGLIQPLDTSLLPDWDGIPHAIKDGGRIGDLYYHMPFDVGFSSLTYDADVVDFSQVGGEESWKILLDDRYKGKMAFFNGPDAVIEAGHMMNEPGTDPTNITIDQINAAQETALKFKANIRNYWTSQTDAVNDFVNGNVVVTYTWPDGFWKIKNHPKMKGRNIKYMQPIEGRLVWICGMVLNAASTQPGRALLAMASASTPQAAAHLTDDFQYASAQKQGVAELIKDTALIKVFGLDNPAAWEPPMAWAEKPLANYREFIDAGSVVITS